MPQGSFVFGGVEMNLIFFLGILCGVLFISSECSLPILDNLHTKFQYKQSFKKPHILDQKGNIPFWNHGGSAIGSDDYLRVCPSVRSHRGWAWSKDPLQAAHWYIDVSVRIAGRLKTGADGMAIWVTAEPGTDGPVYGSSDRWKGVGLFLDSFDNDAKEDNPKIQLVLNDGTLGYDHRSDGSAQQVGSCLRDFRNRPYPVKLRLSYIREILEVWVHAGVSIAEDDYELCLRVEGDSRLALIPKEVYFGVSAATGGLSDDHDVEMFLTYSVQTFEERAVEQIMSNDTAFDEVNTRYNKMAGDFEQRRDSYLQEHPDLAAASMNTGDNMNMDWQKKLELEQSMQVVADMQLALQKEIRLLSRKIDVLITREVNNQPGSPSNRGIGGEAVPGTLTADLAQIRNTESNILHQLADLRAAMDRSVPEGGRATASEQLQPLYEMKNVVGQQSEQLKSITQHLQTLTQNRCVTPDITFPPCLSPWLFMVVMVAQVMVYVGYCLYTQAQERKAKKFF